ncbi:MAG TPA: 3-deoxy-manno-octulosonate cytidylyltransferase, partial [Phycisphaerae bacterium]|nr:3-deoxy-manno-octulosonate cytidylyltransferase [Phycisphaerae bacterium]
MNAVAIIPARYGSTRFPGKPLARQTGKYLIQHVYERAAAARLVQRCLVATDDVRI